MPMAAAAALHGGAAKGFTGAAELGAHLGASPGRPWTCCGYVQQGACACPRPMGPPRPAAQAPRPD